MSRRKAETYELRSEPNWLGAASVRADRGERVTVVDGLDAYRWLDFTADLHDLGYQAAGRLVLDDPPSRYLLEEFTLRRLPAGRPVSALAVRSVPVDRIVSEVAHAFAVELADDEPAPEAARELARAGMADEKALRFVALRYLRASLTGGRTSDAVADWFGCSAATAGRWIAAAKDAGFLKVADTRRR
jgi:hypothetical protein